MADAPAHPGLGALVQPLPAHKQHQHPGQHPRAALPGRVQDQQNDLGHQKDQPEGFQPDGKGRAHAAQQHPARLAAPLPPQLKIQPGKGKGHARHVAVYKYSVEHSAHRPGGHHRRQAAALAVLRQQHPGKGPQHPEAGQNAGQVQPFHNLKVPRAEQPVYPFQQQAVAQLIGVAEQVFAGVKIAVVPLDPPLSDLGHFQRIGPRLHPADHQPGGPQKAQHQQHPPPDPGRVPVFLCLKQRRPHRRQAGHPDGHRPQVRPEKDLLVGGVHALQLEIGGGIKIGQGQPRQNGQHQPAQRPPAELHKARFPVQARFRAQIGFNFMHMRYPFGTARAGPGFVPVGPARCLPFFVQKSPHFMAFVVRL